MRKITIYIIGIVLILSLNSCSDYSDIDNNIEPETNIERVTEKKSDNFKKSEDLSSEKFDGLTILVNRTSSLNPLLVNDEIMAKALNLLYQNIIFYTEDNKVILNLLESYTFDATTNTFILVIKDDLFWDDGEKITTEDFIYSFQTLSNAPEEAYYKHVIKDIISFDKIDENTISVVVSKANTGNPYFLAFPIIPEHMKNVEPLIDNAHFNTVVGNGYYKNIFNSVNNEINLLDRSDDNINTNIKNIKLVITDNYETIFYGFEQGLSNVLTSKVSSWSKYHVNKSVNINSYSNMEMVALGFNFDTPINNDKNFRYSVYHAIPFEQIQKSIYLGYCDDSRTLYPSNHFAYNVNVQNEAFDSIKSYEFLQNTGYEGQVLRLITLEEDKELMKTAEIIKSNLDTLNVAIEIVPLDFSEYTNKLSKGEYDLYLGNFKMSVLPNYTKLVGNGNYSNYSNENIITFINNLTIARSYDEYSNTANSLQSIVFSEKPVIPIVHNQDAIITSQEYQSVKPSSFDNPYQNIISWLKTDS